MGHLGLGQCHGMHEVGSAKVEMPLRCQRKAANPTTCRHTCLHAFECAKV